MCNLVMGFVLLIPTFESGVKRIVSATPEGKLFKALLGLVKKAKPPPYDPPSIPAIEEKPSVAPPFQTQFLWNNHLMLVSSHTT